MYRLPDTFFFVDGNVIRVDYLRTLVMINFKERCWRWRPNARKSQRKIRDASLTSTRCRWFSLFWNHGGSRTRLMVLITARCLQSMTLLETILTVNETALTRDLCCGFMRHNDICARSAVYILHSCLAEKRMIYWNSIELFVDWLFSSNIPWPLLVY